MSDTTNLMLPYLAPGQAQKHVTVNESLRRLDAVVQLAVVSATTDTQPGSPGDGAVWILPPGKTGAAWGAMANHALAYYRDGAWEQVTPREGWLAYVKDTDGFVYFDGSAWEELATGEGGGGGSPDAADIDFDPSGLAVLTAGDVQGALEEIDAALDGLEGGGGGGDYTDEQARDAIAAALTAGTGLSKTVDDPGDTITLAIDTDAEAERIRDVIAAALVAGSNVTITPDDGADTITIAATGGGGGGGGREMLSADRTYYVRTDGNNSNNGLANTSGGAFATIQKALDVCAGVDFGGHAVTIQIGDGTYTAGAVVPRMTGQAGAANLTLKGNTSTPGNVIVSTTSADCFLASGPGAMARIADLEMRTTTSGYCLFATAGGVLEFGNVRFGACAGYHVLATAYGSAFATGSYAITGGAQRHLSVSSGFIEIIARTLTFSGAPAWSGAFAFATAGGVIRLASNTYSGAATGPRHTANKAGGVETFGLGVNNLPGDSNGSTTAPGWDG